MRRLGSCIAVAVAEIPLVADVAAAADRGGELRGRAQRSGTAVFSRQTADGNVDHFHLRRCHSLTDRVRGRHQGLIATQGRVLVRDLGPCVTIAVTKIPLVVDVAAGADGSRKLRGHSQGRWTVVLS